MVETVKAAARTKTQSQGLAQSSGIGKARKETQWSCALLCKADKTSPRFDSVSPRPIEETIKKEYNMRRAFTYVGSLRMRRLENDLRDMHVLKTVVLFRCAPPQPFSSFFF